MRIHDAPLYILRNHLALTCCAHHGNHQVARYYFEPTKLIKFILINILFT